MCKHVKSLIYNSTDLPIDPKPSMIAVTVAMALLEPFNDSCSPNSALTAVVIREKGPIMSIPKIANIRHCSHI